MPAETERERGKEKERRDSNVRQSNVKRARSSKQKLKAKEGGEGMYTVPQISQQTVWQLAIYKMHKRRTKATSVVAALQIKTHFACITFSRLQQLKGIANAIV